MAKSYLSIFTLIDIFHLLENGTLVVPAFQRGYVWGKTHVKDLFVAINNGYPIGMLIAAEGDPEHFGIAPASKSRLPDTSSDAKVSDRRLWILDGSQRLATLYNVLFKDSSEFTLLYDLERKEFLFPEERLERATVVRMSSLFKLSEVMQLQADLAKTHNAAAVLDELNALHERLKNYQIPVQVITDFDY